MVGDPGAGARQKFPAAGELASVAWVASVVAMTKRLIALLWLLMAGLAAAGTATEAEQIRALYRAEIKAWTARLKGAGSVEQQRAVWQARPDAAVHGRRMWAVIGRQLDEAWTLEPAAWLLRLSAAMQGAAVPVAGADAGAAAGGSNWPTMISAIREAVKKHHLQSSNPGLTEMCMALVDVPDPSSLTILEKIERGHPSKKVQGVAALGISMLLQTLGDEGEVMRRRLSMLRKAIIESAEVEFDGVTVAKIAEDELYVISHLSKGRVAPELAGKDVAGRAMKLSDYKGKVVVLLFWSTAGGDVEQLIRISKELVGHYRDKPFALLGVNSDPAATLRQLVAAGVVAWPNISDPMGSLAAEYRVSALPLALVIDQSGVIRYIGSPGSFVDLTVEAVLSGK